MDNGQTQAPQGQPEEQAFFTNGIGNLPPEGSDMSIPNLESDYFQDSKETARQAAVRASLGNVAIKPQSQPEEPAPVPSLDANIPLPLPGESIPTPLTGETNSTPRLGQIVDLNTPTLVPEDTTEQTPSNDIEKKIQDSFGDALVDKGKDMVLIKTAESKLSQDDKIDDFYDFWQKARSAARENAKKDMK